VAVALARSGPKEPSQGIASAKEPTQLMELWTPHARQLFETMGKQSQELTSQKLASASAEPLSRSFHEALKS